MAPQRYDRLHRLYEEFDTETLQAHQRFVDLFPPVDSPVALSHWEEASEELGRLKAEIAASFTAGDDVTAGETFAEIAARADHDQAFTALDLDSSYDRAVNALVLDVDETLRSAGGTDNEIPRETLHALVEFHEAGVPIIICTGQTLENVKGFMIQGLGSEIVHSGELSIVYEAGTGVFTPGHGSETKQLLYEGLDDDIQAIFDSVRSRVLPEAPPELRRGCHLQGNEFNITLKPNFETGSQRAASVIDAGLVYLIDLLAKAVGITVDTEAVDGSHSLPAVARAYYADADPEIHDVLASEDALPDCSVNDIPETLRSTFDRIDVAYYHADAAEIGSLELNKAAGVEAALDVVDVDDPFVLVMGDSKSDLRVMEWVAADNCGLSAAPDHSSAGVLDHVRSTDGLVFDRGASAAMLQTIYVYNLLTELD
ncbi:hydroxymethylpyrimidine pyrophosphatase-like HAD family hydrolase [Halohasta litchfieldiae]|jgi:hydroxymethylpyrimidine pyrophosphatase-like HAD family hydrolase|uniref:Hydroxymethylpyrimidine pyrophosphatase n=1 Tax=Halohasta litchfieldiae TaxID=1073996 RepID=A0A1H6U5F7_9EURY|nr:HAD hydrolase family protein [Halohasta litchfieldiae]ATW87206.1 hydroxymethylpyrimidine pyrophosphatase-like HAD family hydrolase [Halohasta litchfieldiae]SEI83162.1 Hydroxymethylpyrimidine pyrophosphatase [Halohasta litchfieldiae]